MKSPNASRLPLSRFFLVFPSSSVVNLRVTTQCPKSLTAAPLRVRLTSSGQLLRNNDIATQFDVLDKETVNNVTSRGSSAVL